MTQPTSFRTSVGSVTDPVAPSTTGASVAIFSGDQLKELVAEAVKVAAAAERPVLLKVADVQKIMNVGKARVYELCSTGELESIRLGDSLLIPREAIESFIEGRRKRGSRR